MESYVADTINELEAIRARTAIRTAKALGIEIPPDLDDYHKLETLIAERQRDLGGGSWLERMDEYNVRRKRVAAVYLAGASTGYLAELFAVRRESIQRAIAKALPKDLRYKIANERVSKKQELLTASQVSLAMSAVSDQDVKKLDIIVIAAKMREAALADDDVLEPESRIGQ
jgi:hypothetical protein